MSKITHEWTELGPALAVGDVKLQEGGRYVVCGVARTAVPKRWFELHSPGQGFMMLEYDGSRWYGCRIKVGPEWQVTKGAFEGYLTTLDLRDLRVSEVHKSMADQTPYGAKPYLLFGCLFMFGALLSLMVRETDTAGALALFGGFTLAFGLGLARMVTSKYIRITADNGVFDVLAARFEKLLLNRLWALEVERAIAARDQPAQPVVAVRQVRLTSIVTAGQGRLGS